MNTETIKINLPKEKGRMEYDQKILFPDGSGFPPSFFPSFHHGFLSLLTESKNHTPGVPGCLLSNELPFLCRHLEVPKVF